MKRAGEELRLGPRYLVWVLGGRFGGGNTFVFG